MARSLNILNKFEFKTILLDGIAMLKWFVKNCTTTLQRWRLVDGSKALQNKKQDLTEMKWKPDSQFRKPKLALIDFQGPFKKFGLKNCCKSKREEPHFSL